jgi:seryl-tRNA(Sec) selenium transferase
MDTADVREAIFFHEHAGADRLRSDARALDRRFVHCRGRPGAIHVAAARARIASHALPPEVCEREIVKLATVDQRQHIAQRTRTSKAKCDCHVNVDCQRGPPR